MRRRTPSSYHSDYRIRTLACVAVSLIVVLSAVKLWPPPSEDATPRLVYDTGEREVIEIEEIQPTRQVNAKPPPPPPPIPIVVPDDVVLEGDEIEFADEFLALDDPGEDALPSEESGDAVAESAGPTEGPKTVRFVEPEYTREARRNRIRAELVVAVMIDERGQVQDAEIVERFLLDKDGVTKPPVATLGYGLEEAALSAADRWIFRPARKNGQPVPSRTTLTFTFGIDA